jgi:regulator of sirC expression with transglutaminase-like and TPR domain
LAQTQYPDLDQEHYRRHLNHYAFRASKYIKGVAGSPAIAAALSHYLFDKEGFRGNRRDYYNPANSYFNDVMDRRSGIPITLAIVYIAIASRLNLPVFGAPFPGHFLVRFEGEHEAFYVDAFSKGKLLSEQDCRKRLKDQYKDEVSFQEGFLQAASHRDILLRLLGNLKVAHMLRKEFASVLQTLNYTLMFAPDGTEELKERGLIYLHLECFQPALSDLENYIIKVPQAADRPAIEACLDDLREKVGQIS